MAHTFAAEVRLEVSGNAQEAYFTHGNLHTGHWCLTFYPWRVCTCGQVGITWVVVLDEGGQI